MKDIKIEFVNIQSHEHTKFELHPGLNFILAEDNNVGKSTIFKVLTCAMQLPNVPPADLNELIRGGCTQARATFSFDDTVCTLWMFREDNKAPRAFFETRRVDGTSVRNLGAPADLREAFDIVSSADGNVVNFNDADSVQLIVQDTPKNDEVLSKVLIDVKVDAIKENAYKLGQQIQQDYKIVKSKLEDVSSTLSTMRYVQTVDEFNDELELLEAACRVADLIVEPCLSVSSEGMIVDTEEFETLRAALRVCETLSGLELIEPSEVGAMLTAELEELHACIRVLDKLTEACCLEGEPLKITPAQLENARRAIGVLDQLNKASTALRMAERAAIEMDKCEAERANIIAELDRIAQRVECPIKGEVYYSEKECIPCSDRPSL